MEEREIAYIAEDMWRRELERRKKPENQRDDQLEEKLFQELNALDLQYFKDNPGFQFYWHMQITPDKFQANEKAVVDVLKKYIGKFDHDGASMHYIWALAVKGLDGAAKYLLELYRSLLPLQFFEDKYKQRNFFREGWVHDILQALYRIQDKRYIADYLQIIRDEENMQYHVMWIVLLLGKLKVKEAIPDIIRLLDKICPASPLKNDLCISKYAIEALSCFRNKEHIKYVEKFLAPEGLPGVDSKERVKMYQKQAIKAIKRMGGSIEIEEGPNPKEKRYKAIY